MKIIALSALFATKVPEWVQKKHIKVPYIMIRITSPDSDFLEVQNAELQKDVLFLKFYDLDKPLGNDKYDRFLFTGKQANQIIDFVQEYKDVGLIIIHCDAGVSRSAGVAAALSKIINGSDFEFFNSGLYRPNMRVYRFILNCWQHRQ